MKHLVRWHTGTKAQTLVFLHECKRPLAGISDGMAEIENEDTVNDWDVCVLCCRFCGHRHTAIVPHTMRDAANECYACHKMTADVEEIA